MLLCRYVSTRVLCYVSTVCNMSMIQSSEAGVHHIRCTHRHWISVWSLQTGVCRWVHFQTDVRCALWIIHDLYEVSTRVQIDGFIAKQTIDTCFMNYSWHLYPSGASIAVMRSPEKGVVGILSSVLIAMLCHEQNQLYSVNMFTPMLIVFSTSICH